MSFIPKNPLSIPEIKDTPSTLSGTRGLFAKEDGFYEVDANGRVSKITNDDSRINSLNYYGCADIIPSPSEMFAFEIISESDKTVKISKRDDVISGDLVIPYECKINNETYKVVEIADYAFTMCENITGIVIPSLVKKIGEGAFAGCLSLKSITLPDSISSIENSTFTNCQNLKNINIHDRIKYIASDAFMLCTGLVHIKIGAAVNKIGTCSFSNCSDLSGITIPTSVTTIEQTAFSGTDLKDVWYEGTKEQWDAITIEGNNEALINAVIHYNSVPATRGYVDQNIDNISEEVKSYVDGVSKFVIEEPAYGMDKIQLPENVGIKSVTIQCKDTIEGANDGYICLFDSDYNQIDQIEYFMSNGAILEVPIEGYENTPVAQIGLLLDLLDSAIIEVTYYSGKILDKAKEYTDTRLGDIIKKEENIVKYDYEDYIYDLTLPIEHQCLKSVTISEFNNYNTPPSLTFYYTDGTIGDSVYSGTETLRTYYPIPDKLIEKIGVDNYESSFYITEYVYYTNADTTVKEYVDSKDSEMLADAKAYTDKRVGECVAVSPVNVAATLNWEEQKIIGVDFSKLRYVKLSKARKEALSSDGYLAPVSGDAYAGYDFDMAYLNDSVIVFDVVSEKAYRLMFDGSTVLLGAEFEEGFFEHLRNMDSCVAMGEDGGYKVEFYVLSSASEGITSAFKDSVFLSELRAGTILNDANDYADRRVNAQYLASTQYTDETARLGLLHSETFLVGDYDLNEKFRAKITEIKMVKYDERDNLRVEFYTEPNHQGLIASVEGEGVHNVSIEGARYMFFSDGWSAESELTLIADTRTKLREEVELCIAEIEGEEKVEFDLLYENVFECQMPENTGIKSAKVVWIDDDPDKTDNAYFELYDSSGVCISDVSVHRSDGLEQEVFFEGLKTVPVAKVKLLTDVANATVTSITYYNNPVITATKAYADEVAEEKANDAEVRAKAYTDKKADNISAPKVINVDNIFDVPAEEFPNTSPSVTLWAKDASGSAYGGGGVVLCDDLDGMIRYGETDADKVSKVGQKANGQIFADLKPAFIHADEKSEEVKNYADNKIASILKGYASGEVIALDDISPVSNKIGVSFNSKNLYYNAKKVSAIFNGITATGNVGESEFILNGTATVVAGRDVSSMTVTAGTYTFSVYGLQDNDKVNLQDASTGKVVGTITVTTTKTLTFDAGTTIKFVTVITAGNSYDNQTIQIQVEKGSKVTRYTPYLNDVSNAGVNVCGKNILPYPYFKTTHTTNGVTFTDNGDGSITANGTATATINFLLTDRNTFTLPAGTYSFSLTPQLDNSYYLVTGGSSGSILPTHNGNRVVKDFKGGIVGYFCLQIKQGATLNNVRFYPQIEVGTSATNYESYTSTNYPSWWLFEEDYKVNGLYPYSALMVDTEGTVMDVEYTRDLNKAFADLERAIISLGGNV